MKRIVLALMLIVTVAFAGFMLPAGTAEAGTNSWSGALQSLPTFTNLSLSGCAAGISSRSMYALQEFYVTQTGSYDIQGMGAAGMPIMDDDSVMALYTPAFATDWNLNCIAVNDDSNGRWPELFGVALTAHQPYVLLVTHAWSIDSSRIIGNPTFQVDFNGPGNIVFGTYTPPSGDDDDDDVVEVPVPGPDLIEIPATAVVGTVLVDTPIYFAPQAGAATGTIIEAGKTLWVYEQVDGFYKVMLSGKFFYMPVASMGPNYDAVWNGTPLP